MAKIKRKNPAPPTNLSKKPMLDDDITSESDNENSNDENFAQDLVDEVEETAAQKKLRLAKELLAERSKLVGEENLVDDLENEFEKEAGRVECMIAQNIEVEKKSEDHVIQFIRNAHKKSVTAFCVGGNYLFSVCKNNNLRRFSK